MPQPPRAKTTSKAKAPAPEPTDADLVAHGDAKIAASAAELAPPDRGQPVEDLDAGLPPLERAVDLIEREGDASADYVAPTIDAADFAPTIAGVAVLRGRDMAMNAGPQLIDAGRDALERSGLELAAAEFITVAVPRGTADAIAARFTG